MTAEVANFAEEDRGPPGVGGEYRKDLHSPPILAVVVRRLEVVYLAAGKARSISRVSAEGSGGRG